MSDIKLVGSIHAIEPQSWDKLWASDYPFIRHAFLAALEDSGCTNRESGWIPSHLLWQEGENILAAMPLYLKTHSYGEYVFDWAWADAYRRHGLDYYPKLLNAIPFTPSCGPRLAVHAGRDRAAVMQDISHYLAGYCQQQQLSSWHSLFHDHSDNQLWQPQMLSRLGCQFHWYNRGYRDFQGFLAQFNSRKRKAVRKERKQIVDAGIRLTRLVGTEISSADWDQFYHFYHYTYLKRSGNSGYLNRDFFALIGESVGEQILMVRAERHGETLGAALCFFSQTHLFGRYWGCIEEVPGLHFETCYYQGIEFAIERGLQVFDPGAQGEHKIQRGFEPTLTCSSHWIAEPRFRAAIADFLQRERPGIKTYQQDCATYLPFRQQQAQE